MQATILNLKSSYADKRRAGARPENESLTRANLLLYSSAQQPLSIDGEALARVDMTGRMIRVLADLRAALLQAAVGHCSSQCRSLSRQIDALEADIGRCCQGHTLLQHWPELDDRADALATAIKNLGFQPIPIDNLK